MTEEYTAVKPDDAGGAGLDVQLAQELVDRAATKVCLWWARTGCWPEPPARCC